VFLVSGQNNALILRDQVAVNIENGAVLIIQQSNASGIVRTGTANGVIVSEAETDRVAWVINNGTGVYSIPFGKDITTQIPVVYTVTGAGSASGTLVASTYACPTWQNLNMPSVYAPAVTTMTQDYPTTNQSAYVVDRFWVLRDYGTWATKPTSNVSLSYPDAEWTVASNTITESNLLAQYWNASQWNPGWNLAVPLLGTNDAANNRVNSITAGTNGNLYSWILVDNTHPLPVELIRFDVACSNNQQPAVSWATASETNNAGFEIERSFDGVNWEYVAFVSGSGNSNTTLFYSYTDLNAPLEALYYRLSQRDFDGAFEILGMQQVNCNNSTPDANYGLNVFSDQEHQVFISFTSPESDQVSTQVFDMRGRLVYSTRWEAIEGLNMFKIELPPLADAAYMFRLSGNSFQISKKFFLQ
jgi:hypothetical protein